VNPRALEAMAMGVPAVLSQRGGHRDLHALYMPDDAASNFPSHKDGSDSGASQGGGTGDVHVLSMEPKAGEPGWGLQAGPWQHGAQKGWPELELSSRPQAAAAAGGLQRAREHPAVAQAVGAAAAAAVRKSVGAFSQPSSSLGGYDHVTMLEQALLAWGIEPPPEGSPDEAEKIVDRLPALLAERVCSQHNPAAVCSTAAVLMPTTSTAAKHNRMGALRLIGSAAASKCRRPRARATARPALTTAIAATNVPRVQLRDGQRYKRRSKTSATSLRGSLLRTPSRICLPSSHLQSWRCGLRPR
jgi:hypothetical protein